MSLLDDVSIVVTPNGYKAGELYAVIPVPTEGAEEVVNGDFATDTDWSKSGATISGGQANIDGDGTSYVAITQTNVFTEGKRYKVTADVIITSGLGLKFQDGANNENIGFATTTGSYEFYFIATSNTSFVIGRRTGGTAFDSSIDNVSVKEYTSADMDVTRNTAATRVDENGLVNYAEIVTGSNIITDGDFPLPNVNWTLGGEADITVDGARIYSSSGANSYIQQTNALTNSKFYQFNYTIVDSTQGQLKLINVDGVSDLPIISTVGNHSIVITANNTTLSILRNSGATDVTIDNISVKEVTRDNVPRIDYTGGGCPHILAEPMRTNELLQSNQFDTTWIQSGTLTSGQDGVGGSTDAWKFENPNATSSIFQYDTTSGEQTMSAYFKKNSNYGVRFYAFGSVNTWAYFDLNNGVVVLTGNSTAKVESVGSDWFRCSMTFNQTNTRCDFYVTDNNATQVVGNITLQMAQIEVGSYPTSYIPTSGSTVTRNQDIFTRDGIGSLINSTEGVLFAEIAALGDDGTNRIISISDGTTVSRVSIVLGTANNMIRGMVVSGGTSFDFSTTSYDFLNNNKIAIKYKVNDFALWINGTEVATDSSGNTPTGLNKLSFDFGNGTLNFFGKVKQLQVYDTALTDEQLLQLTGESGTDFYESYAEMASALTYTIQ